MGVHRVQPLVNPLHATVEVPGSKSIANRALICAALATGRSELMGMPTGDDTAAMLDCLEALGFGVTRGASVTVEGGIGCMAQGPIRLHARLAGTTSRFITALAAVGPGPYTVDGDPPLRRRPMRPLHDALSALGVGITADDGAGHLPVTVLGPPSDEVGQVEISGDVSSQYLSALMLVAPVLPRGLKILLTTQLVSRPYVQVTAGVMASFGASGVRIDDREVVVPRSGYRASSYAIEPDASSAGYPLAAAAICGGAVTVTGLGSTSIQGDARFADVLARMGCIAEQTETATTVRRLGDLHGVDVDMVDMSDLVPTLAVVAAYASTPTRIRGVGFIRGKESDRIGDLCTELRAAGVRATELTDGLAIEPSEPTPARLNTHHDHRLAMAFGLLGLGARGIEVDDPGVVSKSWPGYWTMLEGLS